MFMRRLLSLLGLGLFAVIAVFAVTAATALAAEPINLPEGKKKITGANEGATVFHGNLGNVTCQKAAGEGEEETSRPPHGLLHIHFSECTGPLSEKCTGLGETTGIILVLASWLLPFDRLRGGRFENLTTATLITITVEVHFSCGIVLLRVRGETLCLDLKQTEANTTHSFHCIGSGTEAGEEYCRVEVNNECTSGWILPRLESSENGGAFKASLELALGNATTAEKTSGDD
jgi:hypothetical protein